MSEVVSVFRQLGAFTTIYHLAGSFCFGKLPFQRQSIETCERR